MSDLQMTKSFLKFKKEFKAQGTSETFVPGCRCEWGWMMNADHKQAINEGFAENVECEVDKDDNILKELRVISNVEMEEYLNSVLIF
jgi:hypothetical protein